RVVGAKFATHWGSLGCFWRLTVRPELWNLVFFFSSRRRHTRSYGDWSSDVCSSDLRTHSHDWRYRNAAELYLAWAGQRYWDGTRSEERRVGKECRFRWRPSP